MKEIYIRGTSVRSISVYIFDDAMQRKQYIAMLTEKICVLENLLLIQYTAAAAEVSCCKSAESRRKCRESHYLFPSRPPFSPRAIYK